MTMQTRTRQRSEPVVACDDGDILRTAEVPVTSASPVDDLARRLGDEPFSLIALFVSAAADFDAIVADAERIYPGTDVIACTTAGEIGASGYQDETLVAIGFPADGFAATSMMIAPADAFDVQSTIDEITLSRMALLGQTPLMDNSFAFLLVDGLSLSEDTLAATLAPALRNFPLFGGSAGDGTDFCKTSVSLNGKAASNAAVLCLVRSRYPVRVFSLNHLVPGTSQMVVTEADPERRIVKAINDEPAAREYARLVGKDPNQLDRFTFASHPVVVRIGETHHVRAIQQVNDAGELVFFSAIDEGMVLTVASPENLARHLDTQLESFGTDRPPANVIACDCILRRIEAEQSQSARAVSSVLSAHRVTGFSTYGEQIGPLHVNQTMTGVAIFHPPRGGA